MKKVVLGASMVLAGVVSCALLLAGPMGMQWIHNDQLASAWWLLSQYGLMPAFALFAAIGLIGLIMAVIGMLEKK